MTALDALIAEHRSMYREERRIPRITIHQVPADTEAIPFGTGSVEVEDSGPLGGRPLSPAMNRLLGPPAGYGAQYPWTHSWSYLRRACRADHPGHTERPVFGGALCWQVVSWCVVAEFESATIASITGLPTESVERHLRNALRWITEDIDRKQRIRNARDPKPSEDPTPSRVSLLQCDAVNRAVANFDLEQRIWESQRAIQRRHGIELAAWETEWARRQHALWSHQAECDRCRRAA